jgi:hypothetical protein
VPYQPIKIRFVRPAFEGRERRGEERRREEEEEKGV